MYSSLYLLLTKIYNTLYVQLNYFCVTINAQPELSLNFYHERNFKDTIFWLSCPVLHTRIIPNWNSDRLGPFVFVSEKILNFGFSYNGISKATPSSSEPSLSEMQYAVGNSDESSYSQLPRGTFLSRSFRLKSI